MRKSVAILGGGVIGLCSAYYLSKEGYSVTVIDRGSEEDETACSYGNAGYVCPSHFIPLAAPGMINSGLKWMLDSKSPFYIKPKFSRELLSWLWKFKKAANQESVNKAIPVLKELGLDSRELYLELQSEIGFEIKEEGLLMLCDTQEGLEEEKEIAHQANVLGIEARELSADQIKKLQANESIECIGGIYYPKDMHFHPKELMQKLKAYLIAHDVKFLYNAEITGVETGNNQVTAISINGNEKIEADEYILALGAWSGQFAKLLSVELPMQGGKGYSITIDKPKTSIKVPTILVEGKVALTPLEREYRVAGTMEIDGLNTEVNPNRIEGMLQSLTRYFPKTDTSELKGTTPWAGLRPCTPDGLPYIGRFWKYPNLIAATGHSMLGVSLAAVTGNLVSQIIAEEKTISERLCPNRFIR